MYQYCTIFLDRSQEAVDKNKISLVCARATAKDTLLLQATQEAFQLHNEAFVRSLTDLLTLIVCLDFEN